MANKNNKEAIERQQELAILAAGGDLRARDALIISLMPIAAALARRRTISNPGHREDAEQAAIEGIIAAVDKCDPARGAVGKFAAFVADRKISTYLAEMLGPASVPAKAPNGERGATIAAAMRGVRIDPAAADPDDPDSGIDIADPAPAADEILSEKIRDRGLRAAISRLPEKDRLIIERRLAGLTLEAVGNEIGITRERVRQIEARAQDRLRKIMIAMQITGTGGGK